MTYVPDWPLIGEILKSGLPTAITLGVAWVAYQQWKTAKDKLALDLFDRRHAVWREATEAYIQTLRELLDDDEVGSLYVSPGLAAFGRAKEKAYFLFGPDVLRPFNVVEAGLFQVRLRRRRSHRLEPDGAIEARLRTDDRMNESIQRGWEELRLSIEPYMMMGHIAASRPTMTKRATET